ncbi:3-dehydroquinate synthase [Paenibacillus physcomitrellae]|uniref:3-dehydroquinate synthase n=1 Tax=Paenibacillus physcomitrellae TaxID=1619311 RepID=A0ABQ1FPJ1_9BACL|nr:3-dehydroquinate synthase [Paenibacillus physcomitrellae]GGA23104.1 3-dehydroquinate synthase [Paenibacillus physcomitrellae]
MRTVQVELGDRSYPIYIGEGLLERAGELLTLHQISRKSKLLIVTDDHIAPDYLALLEDRLHAEGYQTASHIVQSGEASKSLRIYEEVMTTAIQAGLDRSSAVIALGGGVVGDLAGFVAASYMRGVDFVQIPTTILAHDSSVGGKVAVNHPLAKNMIGAFHQPKLVLYDLNTLLTLPPREVRSGLAEVVKHGLIWDEAFADWCGEHASELLGLNLPALGYALEKGCSIKAQVVSGDERENGQRAILNLGHTIGHALEAVGGYGTLLHGEAISIGMVGSAMLAASRGKSADILPRTKSLLEKFELPTAIPADWEEEAILSAMMHDKKFREDQMVFILPERIGQVSIVKDMTVAEVKDVLRRLREEKQHV